MMAITIPRFGGPEVLEPADLPVPAPRPGEVAIDVAYAGANFAEVAFAFRITSAAICGHAGRKERSAGVSASPCR